MPSPALFLLIATLLPLAGFGVLLCIGRRMGNPLVGWVASAFIAASFGCTLFAMIRWYDGAHGGEPWGFNEQPILRTLDWIPAGANQHPPLTLEAGLYVDSLTIAMFGMITLVATILHIYTVGWTRRDDDSSRLFACLALAAFSILGLVLSGTLPQILAFWMLCGISTYFLIACRFDPPGTVRAAFRALIVHRIGDCGMLIGIALLCSKVPSMSLPNLWCSLSDSAGGQPIGVPGGGYVSITCLTVIGLCFVVAALAHGAQFPLHLWMPLGSQGPLPGATMIGSVTASAAGVYLIARLFPILTPDCKLFIAIIGVVTLTMAVLIALAQKDIVRLLAWLTLSQVGYMMLAMGVGS